MKKIKVIIFTLLIMMTVTFLSSAAMAISADNDLENKVFRLHVIAQSNSVDDQLLKLKVRDSVLNVSQTLFADAKSAAEAKNKAEENLSQFSDAANNTLKSNDSEYTVTVSVENRFFPTKEYENGVLLPAGNYNALVVTIGEGRGENWWCVMFPQICLSGAINTQMKDVLDDDELELTKRPETKNEKIKFKTVEMFNMLSESVKEIIE